MRIDGGGGYANLDVQGTTEINIIPSPEENRVHLELDTVTGSGIGIGVPLDSDAARVLGERLLAHSVLLSEAKAE